MNEPDHLFRTHWACGVLLSHLSPEQRVQCIRLLASLYNVNLGVRDARGATATDAAGAAQEARDRDAEGAVGGVPGSTGPPRPVEGRP